ncbi:M12 family metallopeptidase, partial [Paenibacillus polymyxa]|uniref:M12 family metallopeptidase n=1 Tax=Paenibacillus polymyxa TaxID=1406 RepID=UPI0006BED792
KTIYYEISSSLPDNFRVTNAFKEWETKTGMKFIKRTTQPNYVAFIQAPEGRSCYSTHIGMRGGKQEVGLGANCSTGNAIHEIAHVIGYWHEQSRKDRDNFVTIHRENILPGYERNFDKHISDGQDVGAYDYGSIMHYPRKAFSKNNKDTIVPTDPNAKIGQREKLSNQDIQTINVIYNLISV